MNSDALACGKAFALKVEADPKFRKDWEAVSDRCARIAIALSTPEFKAECDRLLAEWEEEYGVPLPQTEEELQRWMIRVGGTPKEFLDSTPAEIVSFVEGYTLRLRDLKSATSAPEYGGPAQTCPSSSNTDSRVTLEQRAIAILVQHLTWSIKDIAKSLGCNNRSLYRLRLFKAAFNQLQQRDLPPRGFKQDGRVEAAYE